MHWLLLLSILSSTTSVKQGADVSTANRLVENALRQKLGGARQVQVQLAPTSGRSPGNFDRIVVNLDGFSADRLEARAAVNSSSYNNSSYPPAIYPPADGSADESGKLNTKSLGKSDIETILGGVLGGSSGGSTTGTGIGDILNSFLRGGRIGRLQFKATNFTYGGAQYDALSADVGEIKFDWAKALRGEMDIKSVQPGTLAMSLRADQAAKLLAPRLPQLDNLKVSFRDGRAFLAARSNMYGVKIPFEVGAKITVTGNQVIADGWKASLANATVPGVVLNQITQRANPIYDFDPKRKWPISVDLQTAGTPTNALALRGGLRWLGFNRKETAPQPEPQDNPQNEGNIFDIFKPK